MIPIKTADESMEHDNDHPDFIQDSISIQENLLKSLHDRLLGLDQDIEFHNEKIQRHKESLHMIQQKESSLKRRRESSSTQVKNLRVTLDKTITTLKKKMKAYNERFAQFKDEPDSHTSLQHDESMTADSIGDVHSENISSDDAEMVHKIASDYVTLRKQTTLPFYLGHWYNQKDNLDGKDKKKSDPHSILHDRTSSALQHMISIAQREVAERRRYLKGEDEIFMDYYSSLQNTTLDWRILAKYDPFYTPPSSIQSDAHLTDIVAPMRKSSIDPHQIVCRKALFGKCDDASCTYQHFSGRANVKSKMYRLRTVPIKRKRVYLDHKNYPIPNPSSTKGERLWEDGCKDEVDSVHFDDDDDDNNNTSNDDNHKSEERQVKSSTHDENCNTLSMKNRAASFNFSNSFEDNEDFIALPEEDDDDEPLDSEKSSKLNPVFEAMQETIFDEMDNTSSIEAKKTHECSKDHNVTEELKRIGILLYQENDDEILALDYDNINDDSFWNIFIVFILGVHIGIYSGRFDVVEGIMILWEKKECQTTNDEFSILASRIMCDVQSLIDFILNHQSSMHPSAIFWIHLLLSNTVRFLVESVDTTFEDCIYQYEMLSSQIMFFGNSAESKSHVNAQLLTSFDGQITALQQKMCDKNNLRFAYISATVIGHEMSVAVSNILQGASDPQTVIEKCIFPICTMLKHHSRIFSMMRLSSDTGKKAQTILGPTAQIVCFALFGSAIFTSFSALFDLTLRDGKWTRNNPFSSRTEGTLFEAKSLLMQCITYLDFSGSLEDSIDVHILLSPFFALFSILLTCQQDYDKAYKLLVSVLQPRSNMSTVSALLWSQLIQLCISFPMGDQSENEENPVPRALVDGCAYHQVYPFKLLFEGDWSLISAMNNSQTHINDILVNFSSNCADLNSRSNDGIVSLNLIHEQNTKPMSLNFSLSLLRIGMSLSSLCLVGCGLKKLPFTFGSYFRILSDLNLSNNELESLPESMQKMTSLKILRLSNNLISIIPPFVEFFSRLERFEASNNDISDMSALMNCVSLRVIIMKGNPAKAPLDLPIRLKHLSILDIDEEEGDR